VTLNNLSKTFAFAVFPVVPYDYLLWGRTAAFVEHLRTRGFPVYFFDMPPASPLLYFKDRITYHRGIKEFLFPKPRVLDNLVIFPQSPIFPASRFETGILRNYNRRRQAQRIIKNYLPLIKNENIVALVETPWWFDIIKDIKFTLLCYDCSDDLRVFCKPKQYEYFTMLQKELVNKSDIAFISAQRLKSDMMDIRKDILVEYLPNGVDTEIFTNKRMSATIPREMQALPRPIIGFVGALYSWINIELIEKTAKYFPNCSVVLIGPVENNKVPKLPNLHFMGRKPYSIIPEYVSAFDVSIAPFRDDPLSAKVDPVKVYEYLSLGKPVVAINLPELERIRNLIYLAKNENEFIQLINQALKENDQQIKQKRIEYARQNSWENRVSRLLEVISFELEKKSKI
jgi:glycosyltransferase involved in cell wall biosynthesis